MLTGLLIDFHFRKKPVSAFGKDFHDLVYFCLRIDSCPPWAKLYFDCINRPFLSVVCEHIDVEKITTRVHSLARIKMHQMIFALFRCFLLEGLIRKKPRTKKRGISRHRKKNKEDNNIYLIDISFSSWDALFGFPTLDRSLSLRFSIYS